MAEFIVREFETMVDDTLQRIVDANVGITNTYPGSVIRTIVEAILAEADIQNYSIDQIYKAMNIDTATGSDLDATVAILGVTRRTATYAEGTVVFGRSDIYASDIAIQYAQMVSTRQNVDGSIREFIVIDEGAKLPAGDLQVTVNIRALEPGRIYLPTNTITVINTSVIGIHYVTNDVEFIGGSDAETDDELRIRAKQALAGLGKGTATALRNAVISIPGVVDAVPMDLSRGVGTSDMVVVTNDIPPSTTLMNAINEVVRITKSAGIDVGIIYPTISAQNIVVTITNMLGMAVSNDDIDKAGTAILTYCNNLSIGDTLIISQLERAIGDAINNTDIDVVVKTPNSNIIPTTTQVIRSGTITINEVVWNE